MGVPLQTALNVIAKDSFRDQADLDYINARHCWRMRFREQFLWSALQCHEKYLKAILLFNGRPARHGHDLTKLLLDVRRITDLQVTLPPWVDEFFSQLTEFGNNRYLTRQTYSRGKFHRKLDEAVWWVRRYCDYYRVKFKDVNTGKTIDLFPMYVANINNPVHRKRPTRYHQFNGGIETILKRPSTDEARRALVWNNMFYAVRVRHAVSYSQWSSSAVPPNHREWLRDDPALYAEVSKFVRFS